MTRRLDYAPDEPPIRLRPCRPRGKSSNGRIWASVYLLLREAGRSLRKARRRDTLRRRCAVVGATRPYLQRVAVRVTYAKNKSTGGWRAHGRYIARESAAQCRQAGFNQTENAIDVARKLDEWQRANDQRLWKIIVSPEFGDCVDLKRLTRELLRRMETDLGTRLEWVAVTHSNTEHRHVHVALRGLRDNGRPLLLPRDYIKHVIRQHAEELCTVQLGYRTQFDQEEAYRREILQRRFTSLDRIIARNNATEGVEYFIVDLDQVAKRLEPLIIARLQSLATMGLCETAGESAWRIRSDFEQVLRSMQNASDHQRTLANHGLPVSDNRLAFAAVDHRNPPRELEGRVLVHGDDDASRLYFMLEGTDAKIYFVPCTPDLERARAEGKLRVGSFIALRRQLKDGRSVLKVQDLGNAEALLANTQHFEQRVLRMRRQDVLRNEEWQGWLGRYQSILRDTAQRRKHHELSTDRGR